MRDFDATRAEFDRQLHHACGARDVRAVHHGIDGERQTRLDRPVRDLLLARKGAVVAGDTVGGRSLRVLKRELDVIEPRLDQGIEQLAVETDARRNQVGVEPDIGAMRGQFGNVGAHARLAAREMHVQDAGFRRFRKHALPGRLIQLGGWFFEFERVRAIWAAERAAVGQLREHAGRRGDGLARDHRSTMRLVARSATSFVTSRSIVSRGA